MDPPKFTNRAAARGCEEEAVVLSIVDVTGAEFEGHAARLP